MSGDRLRLLRSLATIGLAIAGPVTLFAGIFVFGTLWRGTPRFLLGLFLFSLAGSALSVVVYVAVDIQDRNRQPDRGDPSGGAEHQ